MSIFKRFVRLFIREPKAGGGPGSHFNREGVSRDARDGSGKGEQRQRGGRDAQAGVACQDGPFAETKELIAGYWLWNVKSLQEAIDWVKRCPNPTGEDGEIEIRPLFEAEDFGTEMTPELSEQENRLRAQATGAKK